ncbi:MAG: hypothetical protein ACK4M9_22565 [Anaerobacillus sp.]|uniref:hypothetical protein n=1 Tax=Anaerobacillus sp. TaxID=1872506 RepID=UPI00391D77C0
MKTRTMVLFFFFFLLLTDCSQKLPYAVSEEQYKIFYIAPPELKDDKFWDYFQWLTDFQEDKSEVGLLVFSLHLTQETYPSLNAKEAPYFYILDQKRILLETTNFEEIKEFLIENIE